MILCTRILEKCIQAKRHDESEPPKEDEVNTPVPDLSIVTNRMARTRPYYNIIVIIIKDTLGTIQIQLVCPL